MLEFDKGYCNQPFVSLCQEYPGIEVYPQTRFRTEWGPIFHRGRLDGSARVLIIGQDPAQHETIVRRILVGEAGRRVQGLLAKLGIARSYVMINTFLYSAYGSVPTGNRRNTQLVEYRNKWLDSLLLNETIEAVLALGKNAAEAWQMWKDTANGKKINTPFAPITHPTQPESSSKGDKIKLKENTKKMLQNWNTALQALAPAILHPDNSVTLAPYGDAFRDGERLEIPAFDYPAGLPAWMKEQNGWARRVGKTDKKKRSNITITVPKQYVP
jgi:hypothetical protein